MRKTLIKLLVYLGGDQMANVLHPRDARKIKGNIVSRTRVFSKGGD